MNLLRFLFLTFFIALSAPAFADWPAWEDTAAWEAYLKTGADPDDRNHGDYTPMYFAIRNAPELIPILLRHGADPNTPADRTLMPLELAIREPCCPLASVKLLIDAGASLERPGRGASLLILALESGKPDVASLLLDHGFSPTETGIRHIVGKMKDDVRTEIIHPIPLAAGLGDPALLRKMKRLGADLNMKDKNGGTLLHMAAYSGSADACRLLLDEGLDVNAVSRTGESPLWRAVNSRHLAAARFLLENGANPNAPATPGTYNRAPLASAIHWKDLAMCKLLVEFGADYRHPSLLYKTVETCDRVLCEYMLTLIPAEGLTGCHALDRAVFHLDYPLCVMLIDAGAKPGPYTENMRLTLHFLRNDNPERPLRFARVAGMLLDAGMDVHSRRNELETVLDAILRACTNDYVSKYFRLRFRQFENGTPPDALLMAAYDGDLARVQALLKAGSDVRMKDADGETALHFAVRGGHARVCQFLLANGADAGAKALHDGTAMHYAAAMGHTDILRVLAKAGADVNATAAKGLTPLHWAVYSSRLESVKTLVALRAHPGKKNHDRSDSTPFYAAMDTCRLFLAAGYYPWLEMYRWGNTKHLRLLDAAGLDFHRQDADGNTPLHLAVMEGVKYPSSRGYSEGIIYLITRGCDLTVRNAKGQTPLELMKKLSCRDRDEIRRVLPDGMELE